MIATILKQLWAQRRSNVWIFLELMLVAVFLWVITDRAIVTLYTYTKPTGFDYSHVYRIKCGILTPGVPGYIPQEQAGTTEAEDLLRLIDQIQALDGIENISLSYFSSFYSSGNTSSPLLLDTATSMSYNNDFHVRYVTPGFFDVFRVRHEDGSRIGPETLTNSSIIVSKELKELLFGKEKAVGRLVKHDIEEETLVVSAVTTSIRDTEYAMEEPCYFENIHGTTLYEYIEYHGTTSSEIMIRISPSFDRNFTETFATKLGERAQVNNIYVNSIVPISEMRNQRLNRYWKKEKTELCLTLFILINVFFGIIATFWLRTGYRKGETGLRMALGASRRHVFSYLYAEGFCLLLLTLPFTLFITLNIGNSELIETTRLAFGFWRYIGGLLITYIILYAMIALGVWYPASRSAKTEPAEALHYE